MSFHPEYSKPDDSEQPSWLPDGYHPDSVSQDQIFNKNLPIIAERSLSPLFLSDHPIYQALMSANINTIKACIASETEKVASRLSDKKVSLELPEEPEREGLVVGSRISAEKAESFVIAIYDLILILEKHKIKIPKSTLMSLSDLLFRSLQIQIKLTKAAPKSYNTPGAIHYSLLSKAQTKALEEKTAKQK